MQKQHTYPSRRQPFPISWHARPNATADAAPLPPKTADRTRAIRAVFLLDCRGRATIQQVGDIADGRGLLDDFSTHRSAYEAIMKALRPIAAPVIRENAFRRPTVRAGLTHGVM